MFVLELLHWHKTHQKCLNYVLLFSACMGAFFIFADIRRLRLPKPYAIPSVIGNRCIRSSGCRPEVASDVISGQNVGMVQANIVTKLEDPSSTRLGAIKFAHGRYDDDGDDGVRVSCHDPDPTMLARAKKWKSSSFIGTPLRPLERIPVAAPW